MNFISFQFISSIKGGEQKGGYEYCLATLVLAML